MQDERRSDNSNSDDPLTLDATGAARLIGISRSTFWKLHGMGQTPAPLRLTGRVVRWRRNELTAWIAAGCPRRDQWKYPAGL